ncbi:hypothetical protein [Clavibacter sp. VKM Ac-2542]|uniref:hypothetical protein n=1 Tax=Clavibacter sp. VKM Ac-2542 TaxID=2783811 RepID=UPI00188D3059|nr:hypothetical protein [Clavibacter sp. VKM Ac-2542]MBF4621327.1 hypothetical protein [Clavibacter sp. VKM Ac-2542]
MSTQISDAIALSTLQDVLSHMDPPGTVESLTSGEQSNAKWSCNVLGPRLFKAMGGKTAFQKEIRAGGELPKIADRSFANISLMGEPSSLNHNFCILVSGTKIYLMQGFVDNVVTIVRPMDAVKFGAAWAALSDNKNWKEAYKYLFGIDPAAVLPKRPLGPKWLGSQWVSV